mmetsp:Transcript_30181/g.97388  ORF Transcript_30181/g.97388 Transcript_30181/m.97388 type:complete len:326 (+) Transcript_30181:283-1260(+)
MDVHCLRGRDAQALGPARSRGTARVCVWLTNQLGRFAPEPGRAHLGRPGREHPSLGPGAERVFLRARARWRQVDPVALRGQRRVHARRGQRSRHRLPVEDHPRHDGGWRRHPRASRRQARGPARAALQPRRSPLLPNPHRAAAETPSARVVHHTLHHQPRLHAAGHHVGRPYRQDLGHDQQLRLRGDADGTSEVGVGRGLLRRLGLPGDGKLRPDSTAVGARSGTDHSALLWPPQGGHRRRHARQATRNMTSSRTSLPVVLYIVVPVDTPFYLGALLCESANEDGHARAERRLLVLTTIVLLCVVTACSAVCGAIVEYRKREEAS